MRNGRKLGVNVSLTAALLLAAPRLWAQPDAHDKAAAELLFDEGKRLMDARNYETACRKFEQSQKLDEGVGTLLFLADCYEKNGQSASAWATFREASSTAHATGQLERERIANARAATLEPMLSKMTIVVPSENDAAGLELKRDGHLIDRGLWGANLPTDPGEHLIEASAPGRKPWAGKLNVPAFGGTASLRIPVLDTAPMPVAPARGAPAPEGKSSDGVSQRTLGFIGLGLGAAGIAVGTAFGIRAKVKNDTADRHCQREKALCDPEGVSAGESFRSSATVANIALVGGGIIGVTGLALLVFAPSSAPSSPERAGSPSPSTWVSWHLRPVAGASSAGLLLSGGFQ